MSDNELNCFVEDLKCAVIDLVLDMTDDGFELSDDTLRLAAVIAVVEAAKTFDCTSEQWQETMDQVSFTLARAT